jgi:hypothetical protein
MVYRATISCTETDPRIQQRVVLLYPALGAPSQPHPNENFCKVRSSGLIGGAPLYFFSSFLKPALTAIRYTGIAQAAKGDFPRRKARDPEPFEDRQSRVGLGQGVRAAQSISLP